MPTLRYLVRTSVLLVLAASPAPADEATNWTAAFSDADVQHEIDRLSSSKLEIRVEAISRLGRMGDRAAAAVPPLIKLLGDPARDVRVEAARALGEIRDRSAIEPLTEALRDADDFVRFTARRSLLNIPAREIPRDFPPDLYLEIVRLHSSFVEDRLQATEALAAMGNYAAPAIPFLIDHLVDDNQETVGFSRSRQYLVVRDFAADALGAIGKASVDPLLPLVKSDDPTMRRLVLGALGRTGEQRVFPILVAALEDRGRWVRQRAVNELGYTGNPAAIGPLIDALGDDENRYAVEMALKRMGPAAVKPLIEAIERGTPQIRERALSTLGGFYDFDAVDQLCTALRHEDVSVKRAAVKSLRYIRNHRTLAPLSALLKEPDPELRKLVAWALGALNDPRAEPLLQAAASDVDAAVRAAAVIYLRQVNDERSWQALVNAIDDDDIDVQRGAVLTLLNQWGRRGIDQILPLLNHKDKKLRAVAALELGGKKVPDALEPVIALLQVDDSKIRRQAADILGGLGDRRAVTPLVAVLSDPDPQVRAAAAGALGKIGDPKSVKALELAKRDKDRYVHDAAYEALAKVRAAMPWPPEVKSFDAILNNLRDGDINLRTLAVRQLGKSDDPRAKEAVEPLCSLLADRDPLVERAVIGALGKIGDAKAVGPLIAALKDPHGNGIGCVAAALEAIKLPPGHDTLYQQYRYAAGPWRANSVPSALGAIKDRRAVPALLEALDSDDARLRRDAIVALGEIGDERAVEPLTRILSKRDSKAAYALAKIGGPRAIEALVAALSDGHRDWREMDAGPYAHFHFFADWHSVLHVAPVNALARIGEPALGKLLEASNHDNAVVRLRVADILGGFQNPSAIETLKRLAEDADLRVRTTAGMSLQQIEKPNQED